MIGFGRAAEHSVATGNRLLAGRYQLLEPLGSGGMGHVRRAWDHALRRPVAVKLLELDQADPAAAERFRREARTTAQLSHPNIVTIFDTGTDATTAFLVMELLPGPSLQDRLTLEGPLPVTEATAVGAQAAAALAAAHSAGVVHRDVKPANIAYSSGGNVKVLDFGIAQLTEAAAGATRLTQAATVIGTAAYLSPEQASGGPIGPHSDLYALGCVLFALLTGTPPFTGDTPLEVCSQHLHALPPDLAALRPGCPPQLAALVGELLSKDPAARPANAIAVRDRLAAAAGFGAATGPMPQPPPGQPLDTMVLRTRSTPAGRVRSRPRSWLAAAMAGAVAILAAALAFALIRGTQNGGSPAAVTTPHTQSTAPPTPADARQLSPQQAIMAFSAAVVRAEAAGAIAPPVGQDLLNQLTDLQNSVANGDSHDAGHKLADFTHHLGDLVHGGQLTPAGQRMLAAPLAALETAIPPQGGRNGESVPGGSDGQQG